MVIHFKMNHRRAFVAPCREIDFKCQRVGVFAFIIQIAINHFPFPGDMLDHSQHGRLVLEIFNLRRDLFIHIVQNDSGIAFMFGATDINSFFFHFSLGNDNVPAVSNIEFHLLADRH